MRGKSRTQKEKENVVRSLFRYFELGYSLNKACKLAGIPPSTAHDIITQNESLRIQMDARQGVVSTKARKVLIDSIESGNVQDAKWWLERKESDEFRPEHKVELEQKPFVSLAQLRRVKEEGKMMIG